MFGDQRPAAPWSYNNWWGQWDTASELPNVAGARFQTNDCQAGDIAWVRNVTTLYVCLDPTRGAAVWAALGQQDPLTGEVDIYLAADAAAASDVGPATIAEPLATLDEALRRVNTVGKIGGQTIRVHIAPAASPYAWSIMLGPILGPSPVAIVGDGAGQGGDGFTVLRGPSAAAAGSGQRLVVDPVGGMTVNGFVGKTIEITSGAALGDRRGIRSNTATGFVPNRAFTAAVAPGDTFRILEPAVVINSPQGVVGSLLTALPMVVGAGIPGDIFGVGSNALAADGSPARLLLANLAIQRTPGDLTFASPSFNNSSIAFAGVELRGNGAAYAAGSDATSTITAGQDLSLSTVISAFRTPFVLGLAPSPTAWAGWGLACLTQASVPQFKLFGGYLNVTVDSASNLLRGVQWNLVGGSFIGTGTVAASDFNGLLRIEQSTLLVRAFDVTLPYLVTAVGADDRAACLRLVAGSVLGAIGLEARIATFGSAIVATGDESSTCPMLQGGTACLNSSNTLEAPYAGVVAMTGGRVYFDTDPVVAGAMAAGQAIITQSSTGGAAVVASTFAALGDGVVIANPDLSGTVIGRIT